SSINVLTARIGLRLLTSPLARLLHQIPQNLWLTVVESHMSSGKRRIMIMGTISKFFTADATKQVAPVQQYCQMVCHAIPMFLIGKLLNLR
ncbi:MAG TPA: hypothetical protein V6D48_22985, partial [Oculatellaceae cyanobacterium]